VRENRLHGSEGGGTGYPTGPSYPYPDQLPSRRIPRSQGARPNVRGTLPGNRTRTAGGRPRGRKTALYAFDRPLRAFPTGWRVAGGLSFFWGEGRPEGGQAFDEQRDREHTARPPPSGHLSAGGVTPMSADRGGGACSVEVQASLAGPCSP